MLNNSKVMQCDIVQCAFVVFCGDIAAHLAVCGEVFRLSLALPYDDYMPETVLLNFLIRVSFTFHFGTCFVSSIVNMRN